MTLNNRFNKKLKYINNKISNKTFLLEETEQQQSSAGQGAGDEENKHKEFIDLLLTKLDDAEKKKFNISDENKYNLRKATLDDLKEIVFLKIIKRIFSNFLQSPKNKNRFNGITKKGKEISVILDPDEQIIKFYIDDGTVEGKLRKIQTGDGKSFEFKFEDNEDTLTDRIFDFIQNNAKAKIDFEKSGELKANNISDKHKENNGASSGDTADKSSSGQTSNGNNNSQSGDTANKSTGLKEIKILTQEELEKLSNDELLKIETSCNNKLQTLRKQEKNPKTKKSPEEIKNSIEKFTKYQELINSVKKVKETAPTT